MARRRGSITHPAAGHSRNCRATAACAVRIASRRWSSSSWLSEVFTNWPPNGAIWGITLPPAACFTRTKSAAAPGRRFSESSFMNLSSKPVSVTAPPAAPTAVWLTA